MVITKIWKTILSLFLLLFAIAESYLIVELLQPLQVVEKRLVVETREKQTEIKEERERSIEQNVPADGQASNSAANEVLNPSDKLDEAEKQVLNTDRVLERPPEAEQIIQQAEAGDESERLSGEEGETGKVQKAENDGAKENSLAQSVKAEQSPQKVEVADEAESPPRKENEAEQAQGGRRGGCGKFTCSEG